MPLTGSCLCAAVKVTITDDTLFTPGRQKGYICHCRNCRTWGGCIATFILRMPRTSVHVQGGERMRAYLDRDSLSGNQIERRFCATCGSSLMSWTQTRPDEVDVHAGIFETIPQPEFELFCDRRQAWEAQVWWPVRKRFETMPGGEETNLW